jgi:hypothetical protein
MAPRIGAADGPYKDSRIEARTVRGAPGKIQTGLYELCA